jgi:hypothetical protein
VGLEGDAVEHTLVLFHLRSEQVGLFMHYFSLFSVATTKYLRLSNL